MDNPRERKDSLVDGGNPLARKCPNCGGVAVAQDFEAVVLTCPDCLQAICFQCKEKFHPGLTCEQYMVQEIECDDF